MDLAIKAFEIICKMNRDDFMLISPIICHGYIGVLASIHSMYLDSVIQYFNLGRKRMFHIVLKYFDEELKYGFSDIKINSVSNEGNCKFIRVDDISIQEGAIGIVLSLLRLTKESKINWLRHLLLG